MRRGLIDGYSGPTDPRQASKLNQGGYREQRSIQQNTIVSARICIARDRNITRSHRADGVSWEHRARLASTQTLQSVAGRLRSDRGSVVPQAKARAAVFSVVNCELPTTGQYPRMSSSKDRETVRSLWSSRPFWLVWMVLLCISLVAINRSIKYVRSQLLRGMTPAASVTRE